MKDPTLESPTAKHHAQCPVEHWLAFLGHRWNALVLWHLQHGGKRHSELAAVLVGISPKVLSERLQGLEQRGLLERHALPVFPSQVSYALTPAEEKLVEILDQLELWSRQGDGPVTFRPA